MVKGSGDFIGVKGHYWQEVKSQAFCDLFVILLLFCSLYRIYFNIVKGRVLGDSVVYCIFETLIRCLLSLLSVAVVDLKAS